MRIGFALPIWKRAQVQRPKEFQIIIRGHKEVWTGQSYSPNRLVIQSTALQERPVQGCKKAKHNTCSPHDDCRIVLTTSFHYFRARPDEIPYALNPL